MVAKKTNSLLWLLCMFVANGNKIFPLPKPTKFLFDTRKYLGLLGVYCVEGYVLIKL